MAQGAFRKIDDRTLVAVGVPALEALAHVHRGDDCIVDVRGARNVEQFNLFWAMCTLVAQATDSTKTAVKEWLLLKLNYVDLLFLPDGSAQLKPKSIAWHSMAQAEFAEFFRAAVPKACDLMECAEQDFIDRLNDMLNPHERDHLRKVMRNVPSPSTVPDHAERARERA